MAGEVADLEFSFLTTQGPHHPGDSLFPDGPPSNPPRRRGLGERPCLVMAMGGGGLGGQFKAQAGAKCFVLAGGWRLGGLPLDLEWSLQGTWSSSPPHELHSSAWRCLSSPWPNHTSVPGKVARYEGPNPSKRGTLSSLSD